jgi:hypothetical protein
VDSCKKIIISRHPGGIVAVTIIFCIENPMQSTTSKCGGVARFKVSMQKSIVFLYSSNSDHIRCAENVEELELWCIAGSGRRLEPTWNIAW